MADATCNRLTAIIVNWNNIYDTARCVEALASWREVVPEVIVVDNGSMDAIESIEARFKGMTVLKSKVNLGFGGGNNLALKKALEGGAKYFLLLNSDVTVSEADVAYLLDAMGRDPRLGALGPRLREGSAIYAGGIDIGRHLNTRLPWSPAMGLEGVRAVDYVPGTVLLLRREAIEKAGMLDEKYFFSGETADLCRRIIKIGMVCGIDLRSEAVHHVGDGSPVRDTLYVYYNLRNRFLYVKKHHRSRRLALSCLWAGRCIKESFFSILKGRTGRSRAAMLALLDGLAGRFGGHNDRFIA